MKTVFFSKKARTADSELLSLQRELVRAQTELSRAYQMFDQALDPELVESCIYQISAMKARCDYLLRAIKSHSAGYPEGRIWR